MNRFGHERKLGDNQLFCRATKVYIALRDGIGRSQSSISRIRAGGASPIGILESWKQGCCVPDHNEILLHLISGMPLQFAVTLR